MHHTKLYSILKQVPFLKLGTVENFADLKAEITAQKDLVRYQPFVQESVGKKLQDNGHMGLTLSPIYENEFYLFNDTSETLIKKVSDYIKTNNGYYPEFTSLSGYHRNYKQYYRNAGKLQNQQIACRRYS